MPKGYISIKEYQRNIKHVQDHARTEWQDEVLRLKEKAEIAEQRLRDRINDEKQLLDNPTKITYDGRFIPITSEGMRSIIDEAVRLKADIIELHEVNKMIEKANGILRRHLAFVIEYGTNRGHSYLSWDSFIEPKDN